MKAKLIAEGVASDEFRSFPSGHTGCAACAMLAILLPTVCKRLRGKERLCLIIGAVWTAVVAFSRLMMGAHFLTDVTAATAITLGIAWLGIWLCYFNGKFFRLVWGLVSEPTANNKKFGKPEGFRIFLLRSQGGLSLAQTLEQDAVCAVANVDGLEAFQLLGRDDRKNVEIDVGVPPEHVFQMALELTSAQITMGTFAFCAILNAPLRKGSRSSSVRLVAAPRERRQWSIYPL